MRGTDILGQRFQMLTVIGSAPRVGRRLAWECVCDCGNITTVVGTDLRRGHTTSCGCRRTEVIVGHNLRHGHARKGDKRSEYTIWSSMIKRCENPNNHAWARYGGRGITVCDRWRNSFEAFLADVGPRPNRLYSIDRVDNDGNYEPSNVRWATAKEQANNRRRPS